MRQSLSRPSPKYDLLIKSVSEGISFQSNMIFYNTGRDALVDGLELLGIQPDSKILIPAYMCDSAIAPLRERGYILVFFDIEEDLSFNFKMLEGLIKKLDVRAILAPHYFGFPSKIQDLVRLCNRHGVQVIEDCAHSFLTQIDDESVGSFGQIAIFSMRKTLAVPDGGALKFNCEAPSIEYVIRPKKILFQDISYLIQRIIELIIVKIGRINIYSDIFGRLRRYLSSAYSHSVNVRDSMCYGKCSNPSWMLRAYLRDDAYLKEISSLRVKNYQTLAKNLKNSNIEVLFENIPMGCVPQCFIVKDAAGNLVNKFRKNCMGVTSWPSDELPIIVRENPDRFPIANKLSNTLVMLPVHQNISAHHINDMVAFLLD
ncbi:DegT/DnrJ/EryC1/StrS family aminotransferase [Alphaproteobacteria bacterium]|nr:DegT/DnrJ/EryC1/StrS family aminotransferase [Alphaproteobacteria bacterium]